MTTDAAVPTPDVGASRRVRALAVGMFTVLVAALCHSLGGGMMASPWMLGLAALGVAPLCWYGSARRWSTRELIAVFVLAQGVLHLLCSASTDTSPTSGYPAWTMLLAHAAAIAVGVASVRGADAAVWLLGELAEPLVRALGLLVWVHAAPRDRSALPPPRAIPVRHRTYLSAYGVRGPPFAVGPPAPLRLPLS